MEESIKSSLNLSSLENGELSIQIHWGPHNKISELDKFKNIVPYNRYKSNK